MPMRPNEIKALRERLGLTQARMAQRVGVTEGTICRWECGESEPSPLAEAKLQEVGEHDANR